jgi:glycosyltransferase involved in cell wall biosynthesis
MLNGSSVCVVIPCYKVTQHIAGVVARIGPEVDEIYCVDDACPEGSGDFIRDNVLDPRLTVLRNDKNRGVGGAVITGYRHAIARGVDIAIKIDGDGQMDPRIASRFAGPIASGEADYTKGNRFYSPSSLRAMPNVRIFGNAVLSFFSKLSTGYWNLFDPTNGYTAVSTRILSILPLDKVSERYFFETDMLFRLNTVRARVLDVAMDAVYGDEVSGLHITEILGPFLAGHLRNLYKRVVYNYLIRDFNIASVELIASAVLLSFGGVFGTYMWITESTKGEPATAGTVMLAALPVITGTQLLLAAINYDVASVPRTALHPVLDDQGVRPAARVANFAEVTRAEQSTIATSAAIIDQ